MRSYNEIVDFTLVFSSIDKNIKKIDIIEGNADDQGNFNFMEYILMGL